MTDANELRDIVLKRRNALKTEKLDMSFGELINMYEEGMFFISPEYQRAFRWDVFQQTQFIESILLGIPIPPIYIAVEKDGKWELVDGLQRISTILSFFGALNGTPKNNLELTKGDVIEELEGHTFNSIPVVLRINLKRAICRIELINSDSSVDMRYQLFNRLNKGSYPLTEQEIRNCIFRGEHNQLNKLTLDIGRSELFKTVIQPTERQIDEMFCEELVLRFFAIKNIGPVFKISLQKHLSDFMKKVTENEVEFNFETERETLDKLLHFIHDKLDHKIFRGANGVFSSFQYDAIMMNLYKYFDYYENNPEEFKEKTEKLKEDKRFRRIVQKSQAKDKIAKLIKMAERVLKPI